MILCGNRNKKTNKIYNKIYQLWYNLIQRCTNTKHPRYKDYGGKGVTVCKRWLELENFIEDIDKIDGFDIKLFLDGKLSLDKDMKSRDKKIYSLETCIFISSSENNKIKPNQQKLIIGISPTDEVYEFYNQSEFAKEHNLKQNGISYCLLKSKTKTYKGWKFFYK